MSIEFGEVNKYDQTSQFPVVDLVFTGPKRSLVDRVSGNAAQFTRNTIGTYVGADGLIKTAAAGEPRYTYDPLTDEELGLLVEETRTNYRSYSSIPTVEYTSYQNRVTIVDAQHLAPDGTASAISVANNTGVDDQYCWSYFTDFTNIPTTGYICASMFVKMISGDQIDIKGEVGNQGWIGFAGVTVNFSTPIPTVTLRGASGQNAVYGGVIPYPNNWWRVWFVVNTADGFNNGTTRAPGVVPRIAGTSAYIWGAQIEAGTFPTSYIPTTTSTVTRDPDTITLTNNNIYNKEKFDIINDPFGMSAGSDTLTLLPSASNSSAIKRATVFSPNIAQSKINAFANKTDEFWRWRVTGTSFGLPNFNTNGQVTVDWDDGTVETLTTSDHTFTDGKTYHEIGFRLDSGTYFRPSIGNDANHKDKVLALGPAPSSMVLQPEQCFFRCANLAAFDPTIDATGGTFFTYAWDGCSSLTSFPLINTSSGIIFSAAWRNCSGLTSFPLIDTSSGTDFNQTWSSCSNLTDFPLIDTSSGINFQNAWQNCTGLTSFPLINTSSGTNFSYAWSGCSGLTSFPLIDTSSGTNFYQSWRICNSLTSFPLINTSAGTNFQEAWSGCSGLTNFPLLNTAASTTFNTTWNGCSSLASFPLIDTSNATIFFRAWNGCGSLVSFPAINVSNGTTFYQAWNYCSSLTTFPANFFDSWTGTPANDCFTSAWDNCSSLTSASVENIYNSISVSAASSIPPASGTNIDVDYNASTGTPDITVGAIDLTAKGWTPTLNGAAQTNPYSFASLDLDFATNKTLNDNISGNNLITFTRNSIGTYVDSNGVIQTATANTPRFDHDPVTGDSLGLLIEEARTNLRAYSNPIPSQIASAGSKAAIAPSNTIAPDGTATALVHTCQITGNTGEYFSSYATIPTSGKIVTSVFLKNISAQQIRLLGDPSNQGYFAANASTIDFTGSVPTISKGTGVGSDPLIECGLIPYPNGWYKAYQVIDLSISSVTPPTGQTRASVPTFVNGSPGEQFLSWGYSIEAGSFPTSYIPTPATFTSRNSTATYYDSNGVIQTAGVDVARDDAYLPDENGNFISAGLLLEGSATNLLSYSEDFTQWTSLNTDNAAFEAVKIPNTTIAPDGTLTADSIVYTSSSAAVNSVYALPPSPGLTQGISYTFSVYLKVASGTATIPIGISDDYNNPPNDIGINCNLTTSWQRFSVTFTKGTGTLSGGVIGWYTGWREQGTGTPIPVGPNVDTTIHAWGAQLEAGTYPTSYIPTAGSAVTRAADVSSSSTVTRAADEASITGTNFSSWYNQSEGTIYSESYEAQGASLRTNYLIKSGDPLTRIQEVSNRFYNAASFVNLPTSSVPGQKYKVAFGLGNQPQTASSGGQPVVSLNTSISQEIDTLGLGEMTVSGVFGTGHISRLTYWPKRLTDTSLQYLTQ